MENDIMNVPQPDGRKSVVRKVLPVVWLVLCTALFLCFFGTIIYALTNQIKSYDTYYDIGAISTLTFYISIYAVALVASIIVYTSVAVSLIPKAMAVFRPSKPMRVIDFATLSKKILLAWVIIFAVALIYLFLITIFMFIANIISLSQNISYYEMYEQLVAEGDDHYIDYLQFLEVLALAIQQSKRLMPLCVINILFPVSCAPVVVQFIRKIRAAFMPRKNGENQSL